MEKDGSGFGFDGVYPLMRGRWVDEWMDGCCCKTNLEAWRGMASQGTISSPTVLSVGHVYTEG